MSVSDPDGRIAQMVRDMHVCLGMEMDEALRDARRDFDAALAAVKDGEDG